MSARPLVVGLNGWGLLPGPNGREGIDAIGKGILAGINSHRIEGGLPAYTNGYVPLNGGDGVDQVKLRGLMADYGADPADGLILVGYSDGATTIHREFRKGFARESLKSACLTFVALIDMVRERFSSPFVNLVSNKAIPLQDAHLIRAGKVYYQNSGLWQGFAQIGPLESMRFEGVDHVTIDQSPLLLRAVIYDAVNAYRLHGPTAPRT
ncbi:MAG TPA: hypothetical protein VJZ71_20040 [Phycisphaerae bacterium]|nr:hypothetical protein [Phycisphaerae bacterium]